MKKISIPCPSKLLLIQFKTRHSDREAENKNKYHKETKKQKGITRKHEFISNYAFIILKRKKKEL